MKAKNVIKVHDSKIKAVNPTTSNYYSFYWNLIWPVVESYWTTCLYLFKLEKNGPSMPLPKLLKQIQCFAQSLLNDHICSFLESISSDTIKNAVNTFIKMGLISSTKIENNGEIIQGIKLSVSEDKLKNILE